MRADGLRTQDRGYWQKFAGGGGGLLNDLTLWAGKELHYSHYGGHRYAGTDEGGTGPPIYGHEQGQNEDESSYEKRWGTKGLYIGANASGQWENVGPFWSYERGIPIRTMQGQDFRPVLVQAAGAADIPVALLLGCIMAESELNARAERWGDKALTAQAKAANSQRTIARRYKRSLRRPATTFRLGWANGS